MFAACDPEQTQSARKVLGFGDFGVPKQSFNVKVSRGRRMSLD
jgi:hypothetical protein